jgi:hypothetical protein
VRHGTEGFTTLPSLTGDASRREVSSGSPTYSPFISKPVSVN